MSEAFIRGACPRLGEPMVTGDGLLARLVPAAPIPIDSFAALCAAAGTHGNGIVEISARGSLQVRGLAPGSAPLFAADVESLAIDVCNGVPVLAGPLPDDPTALIDAHALAAEIRERVDGAVLALAPKVSVIVDGGGRPHPDALTADVRLRAIQTADGIRLHVSLAGDAASATPLGMVSLRDAPNVVLELLGMISALGDKARAQDVLHAETVQAVINRLAPPVQLPARPPAETIGLHRLKSGACAIGVALEFGQAQAEDLMTLAGIAKANGATWAATAPGRTLLLGLIDEMTGFALATAADNLGFVVDARDARRRVVACPGAPACASGLIPARTLAAEIASALPPSQTGIAVHVSGCAKGCAHPAPAPLTLVGTEHGCDVIRDGTPRTAPERTLQMRDLTAEAVRLCEPARETVDA
jgi:precorrin-3B synthase